jgi:hypothetical protein
MLHAGLEESSYSDGSPDQATIVPIFIRPKDDFAKRNFILKGVVTPVALA